MEVRYVRGPYRSIRNDKGDVAYRGDVIELTDSTIIRLQDRGCVIEPVDRRRKMPESESESESESVNQEVSANDESEANDE